MFLLNKKLWDKLCCGENVGVAFISAIGNLTYRILSYLLINLKANRICVGLKQRI